MKPCARIGLAYICSSRSNTQALHRSDTGQPAWPHAACPCLANAEVPALARQVGWRAYQQHIDYLFNNRLAKLPLQVIWKQYAPVHFCGPTGSEVG